RDGFFPVSRLRDDVEPGADEQVAQVEPDDRLVLGDEDPHAGKTTSARSPPPLSRFSVPCSSSRTSARTIESPVPAVSPSRPRPSSAIARTTFPLRRAGSTRHDTPPRASAGGQRPPA